MSLDALVTNLCNLEHIYSMEDYRNCHKYKSNGRGMSIAIRKNCRFLFQTFSKLFLWSKGSLWLEYVDEPLHTRASKVNGLTRGTEKKVMPTSMLTQ